MWTRHGGLDMTRRYTKDKTKRGDKARRWEPRWGGGLRPSGKGGGQGKYGWTRRVWTGDKQGGWGREERGKDWTKKLGNDKEAKDRARGQKVRQCYCSTRDKDVRDRK
jgi:hypothetical protein